MTAPAGPATEEIRAAIEAAGGALAFSTFMELALYGRAGFYTGSRDGRAGRRGDFLTSPEVGPLFGAVLARCLDAEWDRLGRPADFVLVDAGAGPGTLARAVLAARPACAPVLRYVAVEIAAGQRARHPAGVVSVDALPGEGFTGVIVANELLDNLPFHLAVFDGAWREAFVVADGPSRFAEVLSAPFEPRPAVLPPEAPHGARAPLVGTAHDWVEEARSRLRAGRLLVIDYATTSTSELVHRPWRSWLRTYRGHERGGHPLLAPGDQDITTDVPVDQLPPPDAVRTQAEFLQRWGIDDLVAEGRQAWTEAAAAPDLTALAMRSRTREAEALLDPAGLGSFLVLEWAA